SRADEVYKTTPAGVSGRGDVAYTPVQNGDVLLVRADGTRATLHGHTAPVTGGGFTKDGASLITAGHDGQVLRWDVATGTSTPIEVGNLGPIGLASMAPSGDRFALLHDG